MAIKKINQGIKDILSTSIPIDWEAHYKEVNLQQEQLAAQKEAARLAEEKRIAKIKCPVCKFTKKTRFVQSRNNGVIGPGYHSHIENEYYICLECGIHYSDLNKPKDD